MSEKGWVKIKMMFPAAGTGRPPDQVPAARTRYRTVIKTTSTAAGGIHELSTPRVV